MSATGPIVYELTPHELRERLNAGDARVVDVRDAREFRAACIAGSRNEPLASFDPQRLRVAGPTPVLCSRTGRRAREAGQRLLRAGWSEAHVLDGGLEAWKAAGLPLETRLRSRATLARRLWSALRRACACTHGDDVPQRVVLDRVRIRGEHA